MGCFVAKILFGNVVADARGKLGGVVMSRNTYGGYVRQKVSPVQPRSQGQLNQRNFFATVVRSWNDLTQSQRDAWNSFAPLFPFRDVFGLSKARTGQNMFVSLNLALMSNALDVLTDPPVNLDVLGVTSVGLANTTNGVVTLVSMTAAGTGYTSPPTVGFTGGGGSGAAGTAYLQPTTVDTVTVGAGGAGYTSAPTVSFSGGNGSGAQGHAVLTAGAVSSVVVDNPGSGYTRLPTVSFSGGGGTGATATAVLTATGVDHVTVTADGTGYTSTPTVGFTGGGGSGAAADATVEFGTTALSLFVNGAPGGTEHLEIWASPPYPVGRKYIKNFLKYLGTLSPATVFPYDLVPLWTAVFGGLPTQTPYKITAEVNTINALNGSRSVRARGDFIQT